MALFWYIDKECVVCRSNVVRSDTSFQGSMAGGHGFDTTG